ncbi:energy transducer TonB [Salinimonas sp. HHU 13199]|uniref:Energy transducer TonB n=1 Tax=Salinimonas profundi TaxID=2729140 RepID=A0ABR8LMD4_9ALTE|nr:energy transducer TonB [Salinimonas profundi]MBD3586733.1 energy transducer TonB [Salinimonas profundi]
MRPHHNTHFTAPLLAALFMLLITFPVTAAKHYADVLVTSMNNEPTVWARASEHTPKYPLALAKEGKRGCAVMRFSVSEQGKATDISVVESVPDGALGREAMQLIRSWEWTHGDKTPAEEAQTLRLDFCMGGSSVAEAHQRCIKQAEYRCSQ